MLTDKRACMKYGSQDTLNQIIKEHHVSGKAETKGNRNNFPSVHQRVKEEPGPVIIADGVKLTSVEGTTSQPPFASIFFFKNKMR